MERNGYLLLFRRWWWVLKYISTTGLENSRGEQQKSMRETEVKNGWLKRQPTEVMFYVAICVALHVSSLLQSLYNASWFHRRFFNKFPTRDSIATDTIKRIPRQTWNIIFISQILYRMFHKTVSTFLILRVSFHEPANVLSLSTVKVRSLTRNQGNTCNTSKILKATTKLLLLPDERLIA